MKREQPKPDRTADARSPIRRAARRRTPPPHATRSFPPRLQRSPLPAVAFNGLREGRQAENRAVPPVSTLLESADRPPGWTRDRAEDVAFGRVSMSALHARESELMASIAELQSAADSLEDEANELSIDLDLPPQWGDWTMAQRADWLSDDASGPRMRSGIRSNNSSRQSSTRPQSRDGATARRGNLPTPPTDDSNSRRGSSRAEEVVHRRNARGSHPLSNSWGPDSPVNGLGDRIRSPTPGDAWEVMHSTITPDATLPSADSSFTSAVASHSFNSNETNSIDLDSGSSSANSQHTSREGDQSTPGSSVDLVDLLCDDEQREDEAEVAAAMYAMERASPEGRERINRHRDDYEISGRRFAYPDEPEPVEIGFRIIYDAMRSSEGRERIDNIVHPRVAEMTEDRLYTRHLDRITRAPNVTDDEPPSPNPDRYDATARAGMREATDQVHDYFRRFTADSLNSDSTQRRLYTRSPPPRYEPLASHPDVEAFTSQDGPEAHPVSPPSTRSERDIGDALLSGNETDLEPMRRIVERLARRDDVPDEWWMSMGLNLSRTRARSRSRSPARRLQEAGERVGGGRIERGNSRL